MPIRHRSGHAERVGHELNGGPLFFAVSAVIIVFAAAGAVGSSSRAAAAPTPAALGEGTVCGLVKGAPYSYTAPGGAKLAGNQYNVTAVGISCTSARSWASVLSRSDPKDFIDTYDLSLLYTSSGKFLAKWPHDYTCAGASYSLRRHKPPTISGFCWKGDPYDPYSSKNTGLIDWVAKPSEG